MLFLSSVMKSRFRIQGEDNPDPTNKNKHGVDPDLYIFFLSKLVSREVYITLLQLYDSIREKRKRWMLRLKKVSEPNHIRILDFFKNRIWVRLEHPDPQP